MYSLMSIWPHWPHMTAFLSLGLVEWHEPFYGKEWESQAGTPGDREGHE